MMRALQLNRLLPLLTAGFVIGLLEVALAASFASLIFTGALAAYVPQGIGLALMGVILSGILVAIYSSLPGTVGGNQEVPAAFMAVIVAAVAAAMPDGASAEETFVTAVAAIALTTLLTAGFFLILGTFKLGDLVRFLPYPVIGGFLAGTGWLLVTGAFATAINVPEGSTLITLVLQWENIIYWLPGLLLALIMLFALRRSNHALLMPGLVIGGTLIFFLLVWLSGTSMGQLEEQGWLIGPFPTEGLWQPLLPSDLTRVSWPAILSQSASIATVFLVSAVSLLLNVSGLELAVQEDVEINRELRAGGLANLASAAVSGLIGYQQLSLSALNLKTRAGSRSVGLIAAGLCVVVLLFGAAMLSLIPVVIISALLLYLGFEFLYEWIVRGWSYLPRIDYFIVVTILVVTATIGFIEAVAVGLIFAVVLFVVGYSRIDTVRRERTDESYSSRMARSRSQRQILEQAGRQLWILDLQGFLFFGTAENLLTRIRLRIENAKPSPPRYILLNFHRVTGLDSTALFSFSRMEQLARNRDITLIYAEPSPHVRRQLAYGAHDSQREGVHFVSSLDQGVEWYEDQILQQAGWGDRKRPPSLAEQLAEIIPDAKYLPEVLAYFEVLEVEPGDYLIRQGEPSQDLYFVQDAQVTAVLDREGGHPIRLETMGGGVVGEIGFYLGYNRTASIIVDVPGKIYRLSRDCLQQMERENPRAAANMHRLIVHLLAERVAHLVNTVDNLEQ